MTQDNTRLFLSPLRAALIDMDGVLYDSMPHHALAWQRMFAEIGVNVTSDEFFGYEGMTGSATIDLVMQRERGLTLPDEEKKRLYARKTQLFREMGEVELMPGADRMLASLQRAGVRCVLVTGSGQSSVISRIDRDYPGVFAAADRITALDVTHGKPHPEPYMRGLAIAGTDAAQTIVIENAPLGVRAGIAAGLFTVAVTTGPIARQAFVDEGADLIFPSMEEFADALPKLIVSRKS